MECGFGARALAVVCEQIHALLKTQALPVSTIGSNGQRWNGLHWGALPLDTPETVMARLDESLPFIAVNIAVLTVSDTRTAANDTSGDTLAERIAKAGHRVADRAIEKDDVATIEALLRKWIADPEIDVVITTGGTGITGRDVTPEAFERVMEKRIEGFGELFRMLSYQKIGTSTMQSRAIGGVAGGTYLFALPGSTGAVKDGWDDILVSQLDNRHRPCNLVELMPRLQEHLKPAAA
jgi:molybdopterin adenylyltransferase